eukprot:SM000002S05743  [mRNA]  locus=s2:1892982:1894345:- [translate_table: standard]
MLQVVATPAFDEAALPSAPGACAADRRRGCDGGGSTGAAAVLLSSLVRDGYFLPPDECPPRCAAAASVGRAGNAAAVEPVAGGCGLPPLRQWAEAEPADGSGAIWVLGSGQRATAKTAATAVQGCAQGRGKNGATAIGCAADGQGRASTGTAAAAAAAKWWEARRRRRAALQLQYEQAIWLMERMAEEMLAKEARAAAATRDANAHAAQALQELREALVQAQALAAKRGNMLDRRDAELAAAQAAGMADAKAAAALLAKVRAETGDAERQLVDLQAELDELAADNTVLTERLGAAEARVAEAAAATEAARCEVAAAVARASAADKGAAAARAELAALRARLGEAERALLRPFW